MVWQCSTAHNVRGASDHAGVGSTHMCVACSPGEGPMAPVAWAILMGPSPGLQATHMWVLPTYLARCMVTGSPNIVGCVAPPHPTLFCSTGHGHAAKVRGKKRKPWDPESDKGSSNLTIAQGPHVNPSWFTCGLWAACWTILEYSCFIPLDIWNHLHLYLKITLLLHLFTWEMFLIL